MSDIWPQDKIERLRELWSHDDYSTAEIARRLNISKNAVLGKAHRVGLASRPSPIRERIANDDRRRRFSRSIRVHLPPLPSVAVAAPTSKLVPSLTSAPVRPKSEPIAPRLIACAWPIGEPHTASFRFCDAKAVSGKPYCEEHCRIAYTRRMRAEIL